MKTIFLIALAIVFGKPVHAQIQHDFSPNRNIISCGTNNVYFVYNKAVTPDLISWDFGDGGTSMLINPVHYYSNTGVYTVKLFITKNNICDTVIKHNFITILSEPEANFNITRIPSEPFKIERTSKSQHHADSFLYQHWLMSNDTICRTNKMDISFTRNGKYTIKLEVANNNNCKSSIDTTIIVDVPELEPVADMFKKLPTPVTLLVCKTPPLKFEYNVGSKVLPTVPFLLNPIALLIPPVSVPPT